MKNKYLDLLFALVDYTAVEISLIAQEEMIWEQRFVCFVIFRIYAVTIVLQENVEYILSINRCLTQKNLIYLFKGLGLCNVLQVKGARNSAKMSRL